MKIPMTVDCLLSTINGNIHAPGVRDGVLQLRALMIHPGMHQQLDDIVVKIQSDNGYVRGSDVISERHGVMCGLEHLRLCFRSVGDAGSLIGPMNAAIDAMEPEPEPEPEPDPKFKSNTKRGPYKR